MTWISVYSALGCIPKEVYLIVTDPGAYLFDIVGVEVMFSQDFDSEQDCRMSKLLIFAPPTTVFAVSYWIIGSLKATERSRKGLR